MLNLLNQILLSDNVVENFYKNYQKPEFKNWLLSILPEIEDCKNTEQDNPWHKYNCLDHILHSVEEMNKQTQNLEYDTRRVFAYTMLLHDIGKPEAKIRRYSKLYGREVDSFFDHNLVSVRIANRVLDKFDFSQGQKDMILKLVKEHDIFMGLTLDDKLNPHTRKFSKDILDELIKGLDENNGENLMKCLVMVSRADTLAQNPKMTSQPLKLLEVINDMLNNQNNTTQK